MPSGKYEKWQSAEKKAMQAESAVRFTHAKMRQAPEFEDAENEARKLRAEADGLFEEAMAEIERQVSEALRKPLRKHY